MRNLNWGTKGLRDLPNTVGGGEGFWILFPSNHGVTDPGSGRWTTEAGPKWVISSRQWETHMWTFNSAQYYLGSATFWWNSHVSNCITDLRPNHRTTLTHTDTTYKATSHTWNSAKRQDIGESGRWTAKIKTQWVHTLNFMHLTHTITYWLLTWNLLSVALHMMLTVLVNLTFR